jgi:hypothetical protein
LFYFLLNYHESKLRDILRLKIGGHHDRRLGETLRDRLTPSRSLRAGRRRGGWWEKETNGRRELKPVLFDRDSPPSTVRSPGRCKITVKTIALGWQLSLGVYP